MTTDSSISLSISTSFSSRLQTLRYATSTCRRRTHHHETPPDVGEYVLTRSLSTPGTYFASLSETILLLDGEFSTGLKKTLDHSDFVVFPIATLRVDQMVVMVHDLLSKKSHSAPRRHRK